ncbi:MAG TPA: sulfate ABC transporter ATP-binding protein [Chthoniobacteraceae bacterium]|nr:sulfate ABC transporter ATP-binding protein [Chthoniobacteraceae bacterium]
MSITTEHLSKAYGRFAALKPTSIRLPTGRLVALLGPSGSGKTTLLRLIAGLEFPDSGAIHFHDQEVTEKNAYERQAGFVFQHYALFNQMNVFENIAFGLKVRPRRLRPGREAIAERVRQLLELVQLAGLEKRYPSQLSGGQRQRIALARALAIEPRVLLLDEPFGALDARVRKDLRVWLRHFHREANITTLFVTHDQEEAFEVADEVIILHEGEVQQTGTPDELRRTPANPFVRDFLDVAAPTTPPGG